MHIAEGFLPPLHAAAWTLAAAPFVIHGARELNKVVKEHPESRLLLGAAGAFTFVLSALKLPSVTGSSSHPTGIGVGAILFRPPVMAVIGPIVLLFQALLLAHGGLTTLGANTFSMAIVGPWVGYAVYRAAKPLGFEASAFLGIALTDLATYVTTATQLALAFPDLQGSFWATWVKYLSIFAVTQVPLAIVEGIVGVVLLRALHSWAGPEVERLLRRGGLDGSVVTTDAMTAEAASSDKTTEEAARA